MAFLGECLIKIDDKGRLRIPTALKEAMPETSGMRFIVNRGFENCLTLYPYEVWVKVKSNVDKLNTYNSKKREFVRKFYSGATEMTLDTGDRINVPKHLLEYANITKEVMLTPIKDYFELWDVNKYNEFMNSSDNSSFEDLANDVMGDMDELDIEL